MMEFIAGLGIGLCIGIVGTVASIIWMRDQGYQIVRTDKLTGREAEELAKALEDVRADDKALTTRLDAVNGLLDEQADRLGELTVTQRTQGERIDKLVDVVAMEGE